MITVAIPYYNSEKYLEQSLEIPLSSNFVSEIIIHDDCSSNKVESTHPKIKVYRNETNVGAFKNKYLAVSKSTNEWVYLLDSDNYFFDNYQGIPKNGYTELFEKLLDGIEVRLNTDYFSNREYFDNISEKIIYLLVVSRIV